MRGVLACGGMWLNERGVDTISKNESLKYGAETAIAGVVKGGVGC